MNGRYPTSVRGGRTQTRWDTAELVTEWAAWQQWRGLSARTINVRTQVVTRFASHLAPRHLMDADDSDVLMFLSGDIVARTRAHYLSHLSVFYQWAIDRGYTDVNPTAPIQRPKTPRSLPRPIGHDSLVKAIDCAGVKMRAWLLLAALAGLRATEIANLKPADVRDDSLRIVGKGGAERIVPAHELVTDAIGEAPPPYDVTPGRLSQKVGDYLDGLGIDDTLHSLRHAFATNVYAASGFDLLVTSELLGHASVATTQIYTKVDRSQAEEAVRRLTL